MAPAEALSAISRAKNALQGPQAVAEQAQTPFERRVAEVYREYEQLLAAHNALDFDDLLLRTACLLRDRPDIRELLGRRFRYVLIDEYQDTNHAQYVIAHGIAMDHENIAVTGDPDQSIYAWRGADIRNILEFESDYPNAVVVRLEENYRSTAADPRRRVAPDRPQRPPQATRTSGPAAPAARTSAWSAWTTSTPRPATWPRSLPQAARRPATWPSSTASTPCRACWRRRC